MTDFILPDLLQPNLRVVFCGTAAGDTSAKARAYYARPGNRFWATLHATGITPRQLAPAEFVTLPAYGVGLTDIAKFRSGNDIVLRSGDSNPVALREKIGKLAPRALAFNGKKAASFFFECSTRDLCCGLQTTGIGTTAVWVLPSTSGSACRYWDEKYWRDLATSL
jgi:double-stranded uracil-DNA glycosylase